MSLIQELKKRQGEKTQAEFASEMGIGQGTLSRIYNSDRNLGPEVGKKIKRRFPELTSEIVAFLLADDIPLEQEIPT